MPPRDQASLNRLIVTADDFGAAREVNEAVEQGCRAGVLTAASLMVAGAAVADAVARARAVPRLRVGLHVVLVDGRPLLAPEEIPDLVGADGRFRADLAAMGAAIFFLPHVRRQAAREIEAQFAAFAATGLALDHVNAHKHYHLHPTIAGLIVQIGGRYGARAARTPREPYDVLNAIEPGPPTLTERVVAPFARGLAGRLARAGWISPDQVFGLRWSGAMTRARLAALLERAPAGLTEIYLHPAAAGGFAGAEPHYRYADECAALCAPDVIERAARFKSGGFADFQAGREPLKNPATGEAS